MEPSTDRKTATFSVVRPPCAVYTIDSLVYMPFDRCSTRNPGTFSTEPTMTEPQRGAAPISLRRRQLSRKPRAFRPLLEQLEARELLATNLSSAVGLNASRSPSPAPAPAPAFTNISLVVPGTPSQTTTLQYTFNSRFTSFGNEIGVYQVQDDKGTVDGVNPTSSKYALTVLDSPTHQILFDSGANPGAVRTLSFAGGTRLAYYLIQNSTSPTFLYNNPNNLYGVVTNAFFSFSGANPDLFNHFQRTTTRNGDVQFAWNDQDGGLLAPSTFDAAVFTAHSLGQNDPITQVFDNRSLQTPGPAGSTVATTFKLSAASMAAFSNEFGLFQVDNATGRIGNLVPGDPGYAAAALSASNHQVIFSANHDAGDKRTLTLQGGSFYGFYLIQNSNWTAWHAQNPSNALGGGPLALFSFLPANPDHYDHMRLGGDHTLAFEDQTFGGDQDFNDIVANVSFGNVRAAPTVTAQLANDTGVSNTDHITSDPTVIGKVTTVAPLVSLKAGFGSTPPSAFTDVTSAVNADGTFTLSRALLATVNGGSLPDGSYTLHLQATDKNGDKSAVFDLSFTLLTNSPITFDLDPAYDTPPLGDHVTMFSLVTLRGHTTPNSVVTLLQTGAKITADAAGNFAFGGVALASGPNDYTAQVTDVAGNVNQDLETFTRNDAPFVNQGIANVSAAQNAAPTTIDLSNAFGDPNIVNDIVRLKTSFGNVDVELEDTATPKTVANFLNYVNSGRYNDTIIHRSLPGFVEQGGGFGLGANGTLNPTHITTDPAVQNEPGISNVRGTIAMAKNPGNPNSATSEFFFNLANNSSNLDTQNGGFTAFGHVVNNTMSVVDAMAQVPQFNLDPNNDPNAVFANVPLRNTPAGTKQTVSSVNANTAIVINSASLWRQRDQLTFTVTQNSNPTLVTAAVTSNNLTLTYTPNMTGTSTITVRATDRFGAFVETTFQVTVT
jgi:cyclophilin family peptidyl-prolyl cis-trans isomerase